MGATVPQRLKGVDNMLDVDLADIHRPKALRVLEQRPFPCFQRACAPTDPVALDKTDLSRSITMRASPAKVSQAAAMATACWRSASGSRP